MRVLAGVWLALVTLSGCKSGKSIRNDVSQISMKVNYEKSKGVLVTEHGVTISIHFPSSMTDITKEKIAETAQIFNFEQLDRATPETLLSDVAVSKTEPVAQCRSMSVAVDGATVSQYDDGSIEIGVLNEFDPLITILGKREKGKSGPCATELKVDSKIISKYRALYAKFLAAMLGKSVPGTQASISPNSN